MRAIRLLISAVFFGFFSYKVLLIGVSGIKVNIKTRGHTYTNSYNQWALDSLMYNYCRLKLQNSVRIIELENKQFLFASSETSKISSRTLYYLADIEQAEVTGVVKPMKEVDSELFRFSDSDDLTTLYFIDQEERPRKWYWNALMVILPILYCFAMIRALVKMAKGEKLAKEIK